MYVPTIKYVVGIYNNLQKDEGDSIENFHEPSSLHFQRTLRTYLQYYNSGAKLGTVRIPYHTILYNCPTVDEKLK